MALVSPPPSPTSRPSPPMTGSSWSTPGSLPLAPVVHGDIRGWSDARLNTAVYSHGHIDHVFGVPVWEEEARERGWTAPEVIAHHALPARFDRYIFTAGYNTIINRRQFGFTDLNWPTKYRYPDRTYHDTLDLSVGGVDFAPSPREGRDRRPHDHLAGRHQGAVLRRPVHLGLAQRRQPAEGAALPARMGRRAPAHARPRGGVPPARPRAPGGGRRPGAPGADRHGRPARLAGRPDAGRHERRRPARRRHPFGAAAAPSSRSAPTCARSTTSRSSSCTPCGASTAGGGTATRPRSSPPPNGPGRRTGRAGRRARRPGRPGARAAWARPPTAPTDGGAAEQALRLAGHLAESAWLANPADTAVQRGPPTGLRRPGRAGHLDHGPRGLHLGRQRVGRAMGRRRRRPTPIEARSGPPNATR